MESPTKIDPNKFDGQSQVLYWADALSEIAFVMPSRIKTLDMPNDPSSYNSSLSCKCVCWKIAEENLIIISKNNNYLSYYTYK